MNMSSVSSVERSGGSKYIVKLNNPEPNSEPAYTFHRLFCPEAGLFLKKGETGDIIDIEYDGTHTWITFRAIDAAETAVLRLNNEYSPVKELKLSAKYDNEHVPGKESMYLSQYLNQTAEQAGVHSKTVLITGLSTPDSQYKGDTVEPLVQLLVKFQTEYNQDLVGDSTLFKNAAVKHDEAGAALVQFEHESTAAYFKSIYDGQYWDNATIYLQLVSDEEIARIVSEHEIPQAPKEYVGFLVGFGDPKSNQKYDASPDGIRNMFKPYTLQSIRVLGSEKIPLPCAIVNMNKADAVAFQALHPDGFTYQGRFIIIRPFIAKCRNCKDRHGPVACKTPLSTPKDDLNAQTKSLQLNKTFAHPRGPTDVIVTNLPPMATQDHLRKLFNGFKITKAIITEKGDGFVGFGSLGEAQRAAKHVNGEKVLDHTVSVEVAGPFLP
jgi:hypothetical protein